MKGCPTCDKLIYRRAVIIGCRQANVDFYDQLKIAEQLLVAHGLIKHFDHVVDLMTPEPPPQRFAALFAALEGGSPRDNTIKALTETRDRLIRELAL